MTDAHIYEVGTVLAQLPKCSHLGNHREHIDYSRNGNGIDNNNKGIKFLGPRNCMLWLEFVMPSCKQQTRKIAVLYELILLNLVTSLTCFLSNTY
jgi:hypothetical protein